MKLRAYRTKLGTAYILIHGGKTLANLGLLTKREATDKLKAVKREMSHVVATRHLGLKDPRLTFSEYLDEYQEIHLPRKSPKTQEGEKAAIARFKTFFGNVRLLDITPQDVQAYANHRAKARRKWDGRPVTHAVALDLRILRLILRQAVEDGKLDRAPKVRIPRVDVLPLRVPSPEEFEKVYQTAPLHLKGVMLLCAKGGLRPGEALNMRPEDVDLNGRRLHVVSGGENGQHTKTRLSRTVGLTGDMIQYLSTALRYRPALTTNRWEPRESHHGFIFCRKDGRRIVTVRKALRKACRKAGVRDLDPKVFRKCFASWLAGFDIHPEKVRLATGHSTINVLLQHYTQVEAASLAGVLESRLPAMDVPAPGEARG